MPVEPEFSSVDAAVKALRTSRRAQLLDEAKTKLTWSSAIGLLPFLPISFFLYSRSVNFEVFVSFLLLLGVINWFHNRLSGRIDAVIKILENPETDSARPQA